MKKFIIINAVIWASVILAISYFAKDVENYNYMFLILVFASGLQMSLLNNLSKKNKRATC